MKIASATLQMASSHSSLRHHAITESLKTWVGQRRPPATGDAQRPPAADPVELSAHGKAACASEPADDALPGDAKLNLLRAMIERLTGYRIRLFDARELSPASDTPHPAPASANSPAAGYGIEYERHESYTEQEKTEFSASGTLRTADGQTIAFTLELSMSRLYHEESSTRLRLGDAARPVDPLVLSFAGTAAELSDQRFAFDLDADGSKESISVLQPGSGYLVIDRNGDGRVNDGSELFGPQSGDGFSELARLDSDANGWIDENDQSYKHLQIWQGGPQGEADLRTLAEAGVGALSLSHIATPFALKTQQNEQLGQVRTTGIFLQENGLAGTIQQIDLSV